MGKAMPGCTIALFLRWKVGRHSTRDTAYSEGCYFFDDTARELEDSLGVMSDSLKLCKSG